MIRSQRRMISSAIKAVRSLMLAFACLSSGHAHASDGGQAGQGTATYKASELRSHGGGAAGWSDGVPVGGLPGDVDSHAERPAYSLSSLGLLAIVPSGAVVFWPREVTGAAAGKSRFLPAQINSTFSQKLLQPAIVGVPNGFFVAGGRSGERVSRDVHFVLISAGENRLGAIRRLPPLPIDLPGASAQVMGSRLFVAGSSGELFALDISELAQNSEVPSSREWQILPGIGGACAKVWLMRQYDGVSEQLYSVCARAIAGAHRLSVSKLSETGGKAVWSQGAPVTAEGDIMVALAQGQSNLLVFSSRPASCADAGCKLQGEVLVYNTVIKRWRAMDATFPVGTPPMLLGFDNNVEALLFEQGDMSLSEFGFMVPSKRFGWLDMSIIAIYLIGMVLVGLWFKERNTSTEEYFRGGQSIPWWAAALSIHAALLSSLTYLGLPALVYRTTWIMFIGMIILILITPIIVYWVMPFFRRIDATSAYEYLSMRFNMPIRRMASGLFGLFHVGRMAIVLSLAGLALASVTPLEPWQSVLLMGVLSITYSTLGGVEAVVWTEALQTLVLSSGALVCFLFLLNGIDGGMSSYVSQGLADGKFNLVDWNFSHGSWMTFSIWVIVLGGIGQNLSTYGADQAVIQRYVVTASEKKAAASIWLNALTTAPSGIIFFLIGTGLYYFYQAHPERLDPSIQIDQIFPTFIANEVPTGAAGLIIAGVFAATQSAVATSMHSISTTMVVDFLRPSGIAWSDEKQLAAARWFTVIIGALGTGIGLIFIDPTIRSLFEAYMAVIGMSMGALGGLFLAGMTTRRVNSLSAFLGLICGVAIMIVLWRKNAINPYLFSAVGVFACYGLAWMFSFLTGQSDKDLTNLTVLTMDQKVAVGKAQ